MGLVIARRAFATAVAGGALGALLRPAAAANAKYRLRYGTAFPATHPGVTEIKQASAAIAKDTQGQVDLQLYPDSQLGSEPDMFSQVRSGALDFMSTSGVNQTVVPVGGINAVAFAFKTYDDVWAAMDGDLGDYVRAQFDKVGLHVMPKMLDNGYRDITTSSKEIQKPADLHELKIRVPGNQLWVTLFSDLGAAPTSLNFGELYASLQTRVVDGQENPLALIESAKLYEVQKYVAMTGHIWDGHYIFANARRWNSMPAPIRDVITRHLGDAALRERKDLLALNGSLEAKLKAAGLIFTNPDKQPFRDALNKAGYYQQWKQRFGAKPWALLEKYTGPL